MQKCRVIDPAFTWGSSRKPETSWERTISYEMHVKGFSQLHPLVPEAERGTFAGLANPNIPNPPPSAFNACLLFNLFNVNIDLFKIEKLTRGEQDLRITRPGPSVVG